MDALISEKIRTEKVLFGDANGGAETERVDLSKCNKLQFEVQLQGGGTSLALQLRQHDAASGGTSSNLASSLPIYVKTDADASYTRVEDGDLTAVASAAGTVLVEVYKEDVADDTNHVSLIVTADAARDVCVSAQLDSKLKPAYQVEL
jgi:hypothetical protein